MDPERGGKPAGEPAVRTGLEPADLLKDRREFLGDVGRVMIAFAVVDLVSLVPFLAGCDSEQPPPIATPAPCYGCMTDCTEGCVNSCTYGCTSECISDSECSDSECSEPECSDWECSDSECSEPECTTECPDDSNACYYCKGLCTGSCIVCISGTSNCPMAIY